MAALLFTDNRWRIDTRVFMEISTLRFVRVKSARVITFEQFTQAMAELAAKRFKGQSKEESLQQLYGLIIGKEPTNVGITVSISYSTYQHTFHHSGIHP